MGVRLACRLQILAILPVRVIPGRKFLVIDDNVENRFLLTRTIQRKYPLAHIVETGNLATAAAILGSENIACVISHRAGEIDGIELIHELRAVDPDVPIIMVSGLDRTAEALAAGATRFLSYDAWLRIGSVVDDVLAAGSCAGAISALTFAIRSRVVVEFQYATDGGTASSREVEPHLLGQTTDGKWFLRAHRLAGKGSRAHVAVWETYAVERMKSLVVTKRQFVPDHNGELSDEQITRLACRV